MPMKTSKPDTSPTKPHEARPGVMPMPPKRTKSPPANSYAASPMPTDEEQLAARGQFRIEFSVHRIVTVIFVAIGIILLIIVRFMGDGVTLASFRSTDKSDSDRKKLLDSYNSLSGNLMSAVIKFVDMTLQLTAAVSLLCCAANWTIRRGASNMSRTVVASLLAAAFSYLVCNGLTALNVQTMDGTTFIRIADSDLSSRNVSVRIENATSLAWDSARSEDSSNNSIFNTVLRSHLQPIEAVTPICYIYIIRESPLETPRVSFDYPSADWIVEALPSALRINKTSVLLPSNNSDNAATRIDQLPVDLISARTLYMTALEQLYEEFKGFWDISDADIEDVWRGAFFPIFLHDAYYTTYEKWMGESADNRSFPESADNTSVHANAYLGLGNVLDFAGDDFVNASRDMLQNLLANASGIVADDVTAEYQLIEITDTLVYSALTLTIPVEPVFLENETQWFYTLSSCTLEGCLMDNEADVFGNTSAGIVPGVQVSALCNNSTWPTFSMTFDKRDCALVVVSIGKKIIGDILNAYDDGYTVATGLRTVFTLTVGMLNWTLEDLGVTYNADCGINITETDVDGCKGLRVVTPALKEIDKMLLLGADELFMSELFDLSNLLLTPDEYLEALIRTYGWKRLVSVDSAPVILLPRNFAYIGDAVATLFHGTTDEDGANCPLDIDRLIRNVLTNHLYAEDSLQMSVTTALHYLLKNAVLHSISQQGGYRVFDFFGNYHNVRVQVSIPKTNVLISFIGCGLLATVAIWIVVSHRRAKRIIEAEAAKNVTFIAEAMLNANKYPRSMLRLSLDQPTADGAALRRTKLDDLEFTSTVFSGKPVKADWSTKLVRSAKSVRNLLPKAKQ